MCAAGRVSRPVLSSYGRRYRRTRYQRRARDGPSPLTETPGWLRTSPGHRTHLADSAANRERGGPCVFVFLSSYPLCTHQFLRNVAV